MYAVAHMFGQLLYFGKNRVLKLSANCLHEGSHYLIVYIYIFILNAAAYCQIPRNTCEKIGPPFFSSRGNYHRMFYFA